MIRTKKDLLSEIQSLKELKESIIAKLNELMRTKEDKILDPLWKQLKEIDRKSYFLEKELNL